MLMLVGKKLMNILIQDIGDMTGAGLLSNKSQLGIVMADMSPSLYRVVDVMCRYTRSLTTQSGGCGWTVNTLIHV